MTNRAIISGLGAVVLTFFPVAWKRAVRCRATKQALPGSRDKGWKCRGRKLTIVMRFQGVPVVTPNWSVPSLMNQPRGAAFDKPEPYRPKAHGHNHYHLMLDDDVQDRAVPWRRRVSRAAS